MITDGIKAGMHAGASELQLSNSPMPMDADLHYHLGFNLENYQQGGAENFSGLPYLCCVANCLVWGFYGLQFVIQGGLVIVTINGTGAALNLIFVILFLLFASGRERKKILALLLLVFLVVGVMISMSLTVIPRKERMRVVGSMGLVISVILYASPLSNVKLVIQTRSVEYVPFFFSFMAFMTACVCTVHGVLTEDTFLMIPNVIGTVLGFFNMTLYALYYNPEPKSVVQSDLEAGKFRQQELPQQHQN